MLWVRISIRPRCTALCDSFLSYWYNLKKCINEDKKGKLRTYFTFKEHFIRETYTYLNDSYLIASIARCELNSNMCVRRWIYTNNTNRKWFLSFFTFKEHFIRETYTYLNDFKVRQAICKIRISAHPLMIEGAYIDINIWYIHLI
jgi:hypothetical protein